MDDVHLHEIELALLADDNEVTAEVTEHLCWCRRCREGAGDCRWLQREIAAMLAAAADTVSVPRPKWREVQRRLRAGRRRLVVRWRLSAVAGIVLIVCFMLVAPAVLGTGLVTHASPPGAMCAPSPVAESASGSVHVATVALTSFLCRGGADSLLTPALVLHPPSPEPSTLARLP